MLVVQLVVGVQPAGAVVPPPIVAELSGLVLDITITGTSTPTNDVSVPMLLLVVLPGNTRIQNIATDMHCRSSNERVVSCTPLVGFTKATLRLTLDPNGSVGPGRPTVLWYDGINPTTPLPVHTLSLHWEDAVLVIANPTADCLYLRSGSIIAGLPDSCGNPAYLLASEGVSADYAAKTGRIVEIQDSHAQPVEQAVIPPRAILSMPIMAAP